MNSDQPASEFPARLSKPAQRALAGAGYTRLEQLTAVSEKELLKLHGMGPQAIGMLRDALDERGLSFKEGDRIIPGASKHIDERG